MKEFAKSWGRAKAKTHILSLSEDFDSLADAVWNRWREWKRHIEHWCVVCVTARHFFIK